MYIGNIESFAALNFYRAGTQIPFEPDVRDGVYAWPMSKIFSASVDVKYTFDRSYYIGEVVHEIKGAKDITLFVDGVKVAVCDLSKPVYVNMYGSELTLRLEGNVCDLSFPGVKIYGFLPDENEPLLFPIPKTYEVGKEWVKIGEIKASGDDAVYAKEFLLDSLKERFEALPDGDGACLSLEICPEYDSERYTVTVDIDGATVRASTRLAMLWGVCRIIDIWDGGLLPCVRIDDKPDVPMRGFHMGLPAREHRDFVKKMLRYVLLPLGYNHVIIEFNGAMRFDSHPEISEKWLESEKLYREGKGARVMHADIGAEGTLLEKEDVRDILAVAEEYGIEIIPEVQSLSHIEYITNAYPELAELRKVKHSLSPGELAKINHTNFDTHCYCPSSEGCMQILYEILDEIIEVVKPKRYVHIGHDEVYHIALCPECKKKGGPRVYIDHVKALHGYLKAKGLGTMLWSDMFHTDMYYTGEEYDVVKKELPKDLILLDFTWYYHFDKDIEDSLLPYGYKIMMGNLYSSHYPRFAKRIAKDGMIGGQVSTWTAVSEAKFAENGKFFDLPYTAQMLWNAYTYDERNHASYAALIGQCIIPEMRDLMHGRYDLYLKTNQDYAELIGSFPGDSTRVPEELTYIGLTEPNGELAVDAKLDRLILEHATLNSGVRVPWQELTPVGKYTVTYQDGKSVDIPVNYAGDILWYNSHYGVAMPQQYYRHQGYLGTWFADATYEHRTAEGKPILLLGQVWDNPRPDVTIAFISYTPDKSDYTVLVSGGVLGIKL